MHRRKKKRESLRGEEAFPLEKKKKTTYKKARVAAELLVGEVGQTRTKKQSVLWEDPRKQGAYSRNRSKGKKSRQTSPGPEKGQLLPIIRSAHSEG